MTRSTIEGSLVAGIGALAAVAFFMVVLYAGYHIGHRPPALGPPVAVRQLWLLFDSTKTMDPTAVDATGGTNLAKAKTLALKRVLPRVGPGDEFAAYRVGTGFGEDTHVIIGGESLGGVPERLLERDVARRTPQVVLDTLRHRAAGVVMSEHWMEKIAAICVEPPGASDYLLAFDYIAQRARQTRAARSIRRRELVVFGDLEPNPAPAPFLPPPPEPGEETAFGDVQVHLRYPYRATTSGFHRALDPRRHSPRDLERFWREYFTARGATDIVITPFDDPAPIVADNVLAATAVE